jgi:NTE family protein
MDALVLSGGGVKGAYQAGAIHGLFDGGYRPGIVTGISVGALNAAFLAAHQGSDQAGARLAEFWKTEVTGPARLVKKRNVLDLVWRVLTKRWDGVVDTKPLADLVMRVLAPHFPRPGGIQVRVGAVELRSGALVYTGPDSPDFTNAVLASTAEPINMPLRRIRGVPYYDGGLRDIAPLKQAITLGATSIVCVLCQAAEIGAYAPKEGDVLSLIERVLEIVTNEIVENDLKTADTVNRLLLEMGTGAQAPPYLADKRLIPLTVIRPAAEIPVSLGSFTSEDIQRMLEQGRRDARTVLSQTLVAESEL